MSVKQRTETTPPSFITGNSVTSDGLEGGGGGGPAAARCLPYAYPNIFLTRLHSEQCCLATQMQAASQQSASSCRVFTVLQRAAGRSATAVPLWTKQLRSAAANAERRLWEVQVMVIAVAMQLRKN